MSPPTHMSTAVVLPPKRIQVRSENDGPGNSSSSISEAFNVSKVRNASISISTGIKNRAVKVFRRLKARFGTVGPTSDQSEVEARSGVSDSQVFNSSRASPQIAARKNREEILEMGVIPAPGERGNGNSGGGNRRNLLRKFSGSLYYMCTSTYRAFGPPRTFMEKITHFLRLAGFLIYAILAFLSAFFFIKYYWLRFLADEGVLTFLQFGFQVIDMIVLIFMLVLFGFQHKELDEMLKKLDDLDEFQKTEEEKEEEEEEEKRENIMLAGLIGTSVVMSLLEAGLDTAILNFSVDKMIERESLYFTIGTKVWSTGYGNSLNGTNDVIESLASNSNAANATMAVLQILMDFCNILKRNLAIDLALIAALALRKRTKRLAKRIEKFNKYLEEHEDRDDLAILDSPTGEWAHYKKLVKSNKAQNQTLGGQFIGIHAYGVMLAAYFFMKILENRGNSVYIIYLFYNVVKLGAAYYIAKEAHAYNVVFQEWIIDWSLKSNQPEFRSKALFVLEKMKLAPLGIGTGEFIVGENFIIKFLSMVASMVMLQVDKGSGN